MRNYPLLGGNCKRSMRISRNANRAPEIADISNAFVDKGSVLDIPVSATVAHVSQPPVILPLPTQIVNEGNTLSFNLNASVADGSVPIQGDHCHLDGMEVPYTFTSVEQLIEDFITAVAARRKP